MTGFILQHHKRINFMAMAPAWLTRIKPQTVTGVLLAVAISIGVMGVSSFGVWSIAERIRNYEDAARNALLAVEIRTDKAKMLLNLREYMTSRDERDLADARYYLEDTVFHLKEALKELRNEADTRAVREMLLEFEIFGEGLNRILELQGAQDKILSTELDVTGPIIRKSLTDLMANSATAFDFKAASIAGAFQEDLLSARLYIAKFLLNNKIEDAERVENEFKEINRDLTHLITAFSELSHQNASTIAELAAIEKNVAIYQAAFHKLRPLNSEYIRLRTEVLDSTGGKIGRLAEEIQVRQLDTERRLASQLLRSTDRDKITAPFIAMCILTLSAFGWLLQSASIRRRDATISTRNQQFDTALKNMKRGLCMFDEHSRLVVFNDQFSIIYDLEPSRIRLGMSAREILDLCIPANAYNGDMQTYVDVTLASFQARESWDRTINLVNGKVISVTFEPIAAGGWVVVHEDVTEKAHADAQIIHMARHDVLTGLPNRLFLEERMRQVGDMFTGGSQVAVHLLDLDQFKDVNDTYGHQTGDKLLKLVAGKLQNCLRGNDMIARMGGDEFLIIQSSFNDILDVSAMSGRLIACVAGTYNIDGNRCTIGASIGISIGPEDGDQSQDLIRNADIALYKAKTTERGSFRFFEAGMDMRVQARNIMELELRQALAANEFELYYQPVINPQLNEINGVEALIRWNHPVQGIILPGEFIPLAEELGLIVPIGEWALKNACATAAKWPDNIKLAVNVSAVQFKQGNFLQTVSDALAESSLRPERLELEITESALMDKTDETLTALFAIRDLGVRIALDDFGTGYSSLSYLQHFPFDRIKIDRSFIKDIAENDSALQIVRAVVTLANGLDMTTTAEGIETEAQGEAARLEGCTEVQGFLLCKPLPAEQVELLFRAPDKKSMRAA